MRSESRRYFVRAPRFAHQDKIEPSGILAFKIQSKSVVGEDGLVKTAKSMRVPPPHVSNGINELRRQFRQGPWRVVAHRKSGAVPCFPGE